MDLIQRVRTKIESNPISRRNAWNHWFGEVRLLAPPVWTLPVERPERIYFDEDIKALEAMRDFPRIGMDPQ